MSSTSAQRSVADYTAAGLNPALAYDRPASSPSGASATIGNPIDAGITSARSSASLRQNLSQQKQAMEIAATQSAADLELKRSSAAEARQRGQLAIEQQAATAAQKLLTLNTLQNQNANQPSSLRLLMAQAIAQEYQNTGLRNEARLNNTLGIMRPIIGDLITGVRGISPLLKR